jgi:hypothetical protein
MNTLTQEELLTHVIIERGYLVVACTYPHDVGERMNSIACPTEVRLLTQPWIVLRETDRDDFETQLEMYSQLGQPCKNPDMKAQFFYRVTTD